MKVGGVVLVVLLYCSVILIVSVKECRTDRVELEGDRNLNLINRNGWVKIKNGKLDDIEGSSGFMIGLKQRNMDVLEQYALNVSDPLSLHYGKVFEF